MLDCPGIAGSPEPEGECVFLARDPDEVDWFVCMGRRNHEAIDVWEVTLPHDFDPDGDPPDGSPYSEVDGYLYASEPIPADRLRFLRQHI